MKRLRRTIGLAALIVSLVALAALAAGTASAAVVNPVTKTFSFIGKAGSKTATLFNIDGLLVNARCDSRGSPVVFAFSSASNADLFGRLFDGVGRVHIIKNSSFTKKDASRGVSLTPSSGDFDTTGIVMFETSTGKVVTVDYALDNSTTLAKLNVCTVYGSLVAT